MGAAVALPSLEAVKSPGQTCTTGAHKRGKRGSVAMPSGPPNVGHLLPPESLLLLGWPGGGAGGGGWGGGWCFALCFAREARFAECALEEQCRIFPDLVPV